MGNNNTWSAIDRMSRDETNWHSLGFLEGYLLGVTGEGLYNITEEHLKNLGYDEQEVIIGTADSMDPEWLLKVAVGMGGDGKERVAVLAMYIQGPYCNRTVKLMDVRTLQELVFGKEGG